MSSMRMRMTLGGRSAAGSGSAVSRRRIAATRWGRDGMEVGSE
jgi:hypothetical protein